MSCTTPVCLACGMGPCHKAPATTKIPIADLTGVALDWAVAMAEGEQTLRWHDPTHLFTDDEGCYSPSTDWSQGGPIIDRERMSTSPEFHNGDYYGNWRAIIFGFADQGDRAEATGPTNLIAAMRCYVASRLGDTVEAPTILLKP